MGNPASPPPAAHTGGPAPGDHRCQPSPGHRSQTLR